MIRRLRLPGRESAGFTLIELLVAILILAVVSTGIITTVTHLTGSLNTVRSATQITAEAEAAMERMARDLRQATDIYAVGGSQCKAPQQLLTGLDEYGTTSVSIEGDYNGDGVINKNPTDNEQITYSYDPSAKDVYLTSATANASATPPLLAGYVTFFCVVYRSSLWQYDQGPKGNHDGVSTWQEVDATTGYCSTAATPPACVGPQNFQPLDLVTVWMQVTNGGRTQTFTTSANLRNRTSDLKPSGAP